MGHRLQWTDSAAKNKKSLKVSQAQWLGEGSLESAIDPYFFPLSCCTVMLPFPLYCIGASSKNHDASFHHMCHQSSYLSHGWRAVDVGHRSPKCILGSFYTLPLTMRPVTRHRLPTVTFSVANHCFLCPAAYTQLISCLLEFTYRIVKLSFAKMNPTKVLVSVWMTLVEPWPCDAALWNITQRPVGMWPLHHNGF